ncbi:hypothetical protein SEA_LILYPAD_72 [Gordonia phage LilyPad]|nr:hypothetical protein SEA_LILYPAD_72 [Gordonia phage LilyPad]
MRKSELKVARHTLDYSTAGQAAELRASELSGEDLGRWMFWETENEIKSLKIEGISFVSKETGYGNAKREVVVTGHAEGVNLEMTATVYVCDTKPKITVRGVEVPEK